MASNTRVETLVKVKISFEGQIHKFRLPLRELVPPTLDDKLCELLKIAPESKAVFERFSDSTKAYVALNTDDPSAYKQLYRAARAKLRLRLRGTIVGQEKSKVVDTPAADEKCTHTSSNSPPNTSILTLPASKSTALLTLKCPYLSNATPSIPSSIDIEQSLRRLQLNDPVSSTAIVDKDIVTHNEIEAKFTTQTTMSRVPTDEIYSHMSEVRSDSHSLQCDEQCDKIRNIESSALKECRLYQRLSENSEKNTSISLPTALYTLSVICNECNAPINNEHYHCSNCEGGDFDLCQECVDNGILCHGKDHWLIKRFISDDGEPVNSTTETITLKNRSQSKNTSSSKQNHENLVAKLTCNCCIREFTEEHFVTCTTCTSYNLCMSCHVDLNHGHNPKHAFESVIKDQILDIKAQNLLAPGRNIEHNAICDGCEKVIYGVRHKNLDGLDLDYCSSCISDAKANRPWRTFIPMYENFDSYSELCTFNGTRHYGVFCDGPLCKNFPSYIHGDRYKCAVCDDTDFCSNCEASRDNMHDPTHPLIKLKFSFQKVDIQTQIGKYSSQSVPILGDKTLEYSLNPDEASAAISANAATQVQTIFDLKPPDSLKAKQEENKADQAQAEMVDEAKELLVTSHESESESESESEPIMIAHFVGDTITDGTIMSPNVDFVQTWYLRNAGQNPWPLGPYVKFVSGTNISSVKTEHITNNDDLLTSRSSACNLKVAPGQTIGFSVSLKAPSSPGNYISFWRLATPTGHIVGPKLWCEINVKEEILLPKKELIEVRSVESSQMIFPTLEKETNFLKDDQRSSAQVADEDDFEELRKENTDDDFSKFSTTSDEYDILDASDEEYVINQQKIG